MDLTAQAIRDIAFREKLRGYHPDDVDAFVEQVAAAVDQLQQKVHDLEERQARSIADAVTEETLRRTLIMAQRTADMVTDEANSAAARVVEEAQREADTLLAEANDTVQHSLDEAQQRVEAELGELKQARRLLQDDVAALQAYVETERAAVRTALVEQLAMLDAESNRPLEPPQVHDVDRLLAVSGPAPPLGTSSAATPSPATEQPEATGDLVPAGEQPEATGDLVPAGEPPSEATPPANDLAAFAKSDNGSTDSEMGGDDLMARGRQVESRLPRAGEDDPFLAELRRAVDEDTPIDLDHPPEGAPHPAVDVTSSFPVPGAEHLDEQQGSTEVPENERAPGRLFRRR
jgi:cell division initiation protein